MNTWRNSSIFRDYTLANCSHDWRVVDKSSTKRYRIYSKYTIEPTRSVNRIKCRIMVWYVESLRHLHSAQCSFSWRNNVAGWRCNSKRKSEEQLEWKVKNKFEKMRTHVKEIFRLLSFPAKQFLSLPGVRFKRFWHGNSASVRVQNPPKAFKTLRKPSKHLERDPTLDVTLVCDFHDDRFLQTAQISLKRCRFPYISLKRLKTP